MTTRFAKRLSDVVAAPERTVASMAHPVPDIWVDNQGPARRRMRRRAWNLPDGVRALLRRPGLLGLRELTFRVWGGGVFRGMRGSNESSHVGGLRCRCARGGVGGRRVRGELGGIGAYLHG